MLTKDKYNSYVKILEEELIPAMGCTEPVSLAYAAAKARSVLNEEVKEVYCEVSGNIIKNVKSVIVPHTGGMHGIESALAAGIAVGDEGKELQVLSFVDGDGIEKIARFKENVPITVKFAETPYVFDIAVLLKGENHTSFVRIVLNHTNIICVKRDGEILFEKPVEKQPVKTDRSCLNVEDIVEFANCVKYEDVEKILNRQIEFNYAIAEEGLKNNYGANIGKVFLRTYQPDIKIKAKAYAAAGSDARMNGCEMPVIINSGSGNQGITASVPVIVYANSLNASKEELIKALCVSNLVTIHLKTGIGTLSAYCGVVSAGAGAGCGIAYLLGGGYKEISHTIVNALAIDSGIICDGAKASCAAKIATAVENGILGLYMYYHGNEFIGGDGIVKQGVENTINSVSRLAKNGMRETDKEIIRIMVEEKE